MQEKELFKIWVSLFMTWLKPKLAVKMSILGLSIFMTSLTNREIGFTLKSPGTTTIYGFLSATWSILNSKFSKNFPNSSGLLNDVNKETKTYKSFLRFFIQNLCIHVNIWRHLILKAGNICNILELHLVLRLTDGQP